jgi:hypothetical protein
MSQTCCFSTAIRFHVLLSTLRYGRPFPGVCPTPLLSGHQRHKRIHESKAAQVWDAQQIPESDSAVLHSTPRDGAEQSDRACVEEGQGREDTQGLVTPSGLQPTSNQPRKRRLCRRLLGLQPAAG